MSIVRGTQVASHCMYRLGALLSSLLLASLCILVPSALWAQEPGAEGTAEEVKPCTSCHDPEASAWMASSHALTVNPETGEPVATCTTCHGDYVRGHPDEALTPLRVDSSSCRTCHAATFGQWEVSLHGQEGVQCISCHQMHSQEMRLTDERQCTACHQESLEDAFHSAHWDAGTLCTECHMAEMVPGMALAMLEGAGNGVSSLLPTTNHDFVSVSAANCLGCHTEDVASGQTVDYVKASVGVEDVGHELSVVQAELQGARQANRSLAIFSLANLGFGLGMGGVLGIVFMVLFARFGSRAGASKNQGVDGERQNPD